MNQQGSVNCLSKLAFGKPPDSLQLILPIGESRRDATVARASNHPFISDLSWETVLVLHKETAPWPVPGESVEYLSFTEGQLGQMQLQCETLHCPTIDLLLFLLQDSLQVIPLTKRKHPFRVFFISLYFFGKLVWVLSFN